MKSGLFILIVCLLFPAYVCADTSKHALEENRKLLHSLDSLLEQQDLFVRVKEERIKQLKMQYSRVKDVKELYAMNRMVYLEYRVYDADSALHYINKNIQLAQQTNNRTWEVVSLLEQSFVLTSSGLLTEALKAVSDIQPEELPQNLRSEYFGRLCTLYSRLRDYSSENSQLSEHYNNLQKAFRDSVYLTATPDELRYWNCRAWLYMGTPEIEPVKQAFEENKQTLSNDRQIALFGATPVGRDFAPRVSSALHSGLTADCTQLEIGDHKDAKTGTEYKNLLYQIRPAFGGNIIATIVNPDHRPQMATVREGVMRKEYAAQPGAGEVKAIDWKKMVTDADLAVKIIDRQIEERKIDIKGAGIIVAGGYGMGSKENFRLVHELADVLGGEVGASRAAVDAGFTEHARQVGQTGVTVRPKLYIACGISGQIQHTAGMDQSSMVISINSDPEAPINKIADYAITGDVNEIIPKMIKYYKQNSK